MSTTGELEYIYTPRIHIINTSFQKQQSTSKLVNRYLSTAAQYLHRTKSFHVPTITSTQRTITNDLAKSMHDLNAEILPTMSNNDQSNTNNNKSQGFVNTLRRSLRKNRERFYNKRSSTMKSCHTLNTCEQIDPQPKFSMTPTLNSHRQTKEKTKFDEMRKARHESSSL